MNKSVNIAIAAIATALTISKIIAKHENKETTPIIKNRFIVANTVIINMNKTIKQ